MKELLLICGDYFSVPKEKEEYDRRRRPSDISLMKGGLRRASKDETPKVGRWNPGGAVGAIGCRWVCVGEFSVIFHVIGSLGPPL